MSDRLVYLAPDLPGIPEDLMLARDQGRVLFLTGAGVSTPAPSNLPDFRGLVIDIYARLDTRLADAMRAFVTAADATDAQIDWRPFVAPLNDDQKTEMKVFARREYDVVLGMLEQRIAGGMRTTAHEVLDAAHAPNTLHASLNTLARRFGEPFLATTNFDRLHEAAAARRYKAAAYDLTGLPRPSQLASFHGVFHIHGQLGSEIALTDQDLGDLYLRRRVASDFIYDAIRIFNLAIIGYSLGDAPFRYLLNAVAGDTRHFNDLKDRFAFVPKRGDDPTLALEWKARSIEPISYDDADGHHQLQRLLAAWAESVPALGDKWARRRLRDMTRTPFDEASEANKSVFGYLLRRAGRDERGKLMSYIGGTLQAGPDWLTAANAIVREHWDGR